MEGGKPQDHNLRPEVNKGTDNWKAAEIYGELHELAKTEVGLVSALREALPKRTWKGWR